MNCSAKNCIIVNFQKNIKIADLQLKSTKEMKNRKQNNYKTLELWQKLNSNYFTIKTGFLLIISTNPNLVIKLATAV